MITNTDCTAYCYNKSTQGYDRHYIPAVMWQEQRTQKTGKQGLLTSDDITIYIPSKNAPQVEFKATKDIIVKGNCTFEFNNSTQQTVSESMKQFRLRYPEFVVINAVADKQYSVNADLNHIKLTQGR